MAKHTVSRCATTGKQYKVLVKLLEGQNVGVILVVINERRQSANGISLKGIGELYQGGLYSQPHSAAFRLDVIGCIPRGPEDRLDL